MPALFEQAIQPPLLHAGWQQGKTAVRVWRIA